MCDVTKEIEEKRKKRGQPKKKGRRCRGSGVHSLSSLLSYPVRSVGFFWGGIQELHLACMRRDVPIYQLELG